MSTNLSAHIASLRAKEESKPIAKRHKADNAILFWGSVADKSYLPLLKSCVGGTTTFIRLETLDTMTQLEMYCGSKGITRVISTSSQLLRKLLCWDKRAAPSLSDYAGSYFLHKGIEVVFLPPLKQLATVPYGKFMATRITSKLTEPAKWYKPTEFSWSLLTPKNEANNYNHFCDAFLVSIDIETFKDNATIRCLSYTCFYLDPVEHGVLSHSVVLPLDSTYALAIMRKWNLLPAPKVFQNGKYDISYLCRYNAPVHNYLYDTAHLFHSWYSELPKDLGFLNAYFIRESSYWKDLAETNDLHEYYRYNALDTWGTGNCFLAMLNEAPQYAIDNYLLEFPLVFPCHLAEMTGIKRDMDTLQTAGEKQKAIIAENERSLNVILNVPAGESFNTNSPKQVKSVLHMLGCSDIPSTSEKDLKKARFRHPFNARVISHVISNRKARKLVSTYLTAGKEFTTGIVEPSGKSLTHSNGVHRILYSLNPHGTDTSRLASREHHFWCGLQIQNIPRGDSVKQTLVADKNFLWGEADYAQAESRNTAYISGDLKLIDSVENAPDFHNRNASLFFGIPEDEVPKPIRQIGKNVNHGANYNMQEFTLIETMGEENIIKARNLLGLPKFWSYKEIAAHLLQCFHDTYPDIRGVFYPGIIQDILATHMLVSGGWTRYCFGNPSKSRTALNAYIAHAPQCLNAQTLNKAWMNTFKRIAMHQEHAHNFKLIAQVHDSILFQYRVGHEYLCDLVKECMEIPVTVTGYDGETRTFVVPVDINHGKKYWSELK